MNNFWQKLKQNNKPFTVLAPLDGVTDYVFREIIAETAKPDVLFTEFTHTDALLSKGYEKNITRLKYSEKQRKIVAQIWGINPDSFRKIGKMVNELGFDGVDINMGCPDKTVMKSGGGAALINKPDLAAQIIKATMEGAEDLPVSVKTRIGTNKIVTEEWISFIAKLSPQAITIHGRTAAEMSKVPAHWDEIEKASKIIKSISSDIVVLGNGDITDTKEALNAHLKYSVDGIMIGRGIFENPWVFEKNNTEHTLHEHLKLLLKHTKMYTEFYPDPKRFDVMKKFFKIYVKSFHNSNQLKAQLMETKDYAEVQTLVENFEKNSEFLDKFI